MDTEQFIRRFEEGALKEDEWHHREHLQMALWYLHQYPELDAILRIKAGILRYNLLYSIEQNNTRGYHETITMFFVKLAQEFIRECDTSITLAAKMESFVARYSDGRSTLKKYYSREVIMSETARKYWVEPDLMPLIESK